MKTSKINISSIIILFVVSINLMPLPINNMKSLFAEPNGLFLNVNVVPTRIKPAEAASVNVLVFDMNNNPVPGATVKISSHSGFFQANHNTVIIGTSNNEGTLNAVWQSEKWGPVGSLEFNISVTKEGEPSTFERAYVIKDRE